jgi:hypothetical protein
MLTKKHSLNEQNESIAKRQNTKEFFPLIDDLAKIVCDYLGALDDLLKLKHLFMITFLEAFISNWSASTYKTHLSQNYNFVQKDLDVLHATGSKFSGSDLLAAVMNDDRIKSKDVDVFCRSSQISTIVKHFRLDGFKAQSQEYRSDEKSLSCVFNLPIKNSTIQFVFIDDEFYKTTIDDYICNNFDLPFLMNTFDGREFHMHFPDAIRNRSSLHQQPQLYHTVLQDNKFYSTLSLNFDATPHIRCCKYLDRGFTIPNYQKPNFFKISCFHEDFDLKKADYILKGQYTRKHLEALNIPFLYYFEDETKFTSDVEKVKTQIRCLQIKRR